MWEICYGHRNFTFFKVMLFIYFNKNKVSQRMTQEKEIFSVIVPGKPFSTPIFGSCVCTWILSGISAPREVSVCLECHLWKGLCIFMTFPNPTFVSPKSFLKFLWIPRISELVESPMGHSVSVAFIPKSPNSTLMRSFPAWMSLEDMERTTLRYCQSKKRRKFILGICFI